MTALELLHDLRRRGIELQPHGDKLRYRPIEAVGPDLLARLRAHKPELLALLSPADTDKTPGDGHGNRGIVNTTPELPDRPPPRPGYLCELARADGRWVWRFRRGPDAADRAWLAWRRAGGDM